MCFIADCVLIMYATQTWKSHQSLASAYINLEISHCAYPFRCYSHASLPLSRFTTWLTSTSSELNVKPPIVSNNSNCMQNIKVWCSLYTMYLARNTYEAYYFRFFALFKTIWFCFFFIQSNTLFSKKNLVNYIENIPFWYILWYMWYINRWWNSN